MLTRLVGFGNGHLYVAPESVGERIRVHWARGSSGEFVRTVSRLSRDQNVWGREGTGLFSSTRIQAHIAVVEGGTWRVHA